MEQDQNTTASTLRSKENEVQQQNIEIQKYREQLNQKEQEMVM